MNEKIRSPGHPPPDKRGAKSNVVQIDRAFSIRDRRNAAYAIRELLDYAATLADKQDLRELSFMIGVASVAAKDAAGEVHDFASDPEE